MRFRTPAYSLACIAAMSLTSAIGFADDYEPTLQPAPEPEIENPVPKQEETKQAPPKAQVHVKQLKPFTGKIIKDRVRMRLSAALDSPIIRELEKNDLVIITGSADDFYEIKPPKDIKAYVYRTFVLDGVVEGNRVNVRLEPRLDAPIIAQLNNGDKVDGQISSVNNRWVEFTPPESTRFFIASEYVENVGGADYLAKIEKRKDQARQLLANAIQTSQVELQKPYPQMQLEGVIADLNRVANDYVEFPDQVKKAKDLLAQIQDTQLHKKVAYLEAKTQNGGAEPTADMIYQETPSQEKMAVDSYKNWINSQNQQVNTKMQAWVPVELTHYEQWADDNEGKSINEFYKDQSRQAVALRGIVQLYNRPIRNKPGDFILVNRSNNLPIAYMYSTQVNLQDKVGQEVTVEGVLRPNNNFAYPAYFILRAE